MMPCHALLYGDDERIANWVWKTFNLHPMPMNTVLGILDWNHDLAGAAMFYNWNGANIELNYYGPSTLTLGVVRTLANIALRRFNVTRLTLRCASERIVRGMRKFGFVDEGTERDFYGAGKDAHRLVIFRAGLARLAGELF